MEEQTFLSMYFSDEELAVISATRNLSSITRVAENITVITAEDIELMNAHTVADVLYRVNGVEVDMQGGPGSASVVYIQGSQSWQVSVFLDGIPLTNLDAFDFGLIPVQFIEKIEIIKGPASSSWGSSLGGVVNIITKSPGNNEKVSGTFSTSYGDDDTGDFRAELFGKKNDFGYYLQGGDLQSDGLHGLPNNSDVSQRNFYSKLSYDLSKDSSLLFTLLYVKSSKGEGEFPASDYSARDSSEEFLSSLSFKTVFTQELGLSASLYSTMLRSTGSLTTLSTGMSSEEPTKDSTYGDRVKLTYSNGAHTVVIGSDYDAATYTQTEMTTSQVSSQKWAVFANDTIVLNKLSITPGLRYDNQKPWGNFTSPSIGITYALFDNTLLRASVARGFSNAGLDEFISNPLSGYVANPNLQVEKIWSYQLGAETTALKYLWLKATVFRHEVSNAIEFTQISDQLYTVVNSERQRRQGFEIDFKTVPVYHFTLYGGTTFIDTTDRTTGQTEQDVPRYSYDFGLKYDDEQSFKALLTGHYIWWNSEGDYFGTYNAWLVDITLIKNLLKQKQGRRALELFLSGHNLFNGTQRAEDISQTPNRWFEGGIRVKF
ncbi:MAG: TonB-dependent receptor [Thermodesulfovibrionales bacterium]